MAVLAFFVAGCATVPRGIEPVSGFEPDRYMGTWYEITRLDHRFERGLTDVYVEYSYRDNGTIRVVNRAYDPKKGKWVQARAVARPQGDKSVGSLKVTFFWPFVGAYNVIALDKENYQWAVVTGNTRNYFWILARERSIDPRLLEQLIQQAAEWEFPVDELIIVSQKTPIPSEISASPTAKGR